MDELTQPIYVFGHKNPDNDSISSAVAYAALKNAAAVAGASDDASADACAYVPVRLGPMPADASWVFARFGVEEPALFEDARAASAAMSAARADCAPYRCILVDHNEMSQSAADIDRADVVEVIDHHRIGDIQTAAPILFVNLPVGATATVVALRYAALGLEPEPAIAGLLLSAIMTDTVMLKSPTTTDTDRTVAAELATRAGIDDYLAFGLEILQSRRDGKPLDVAAVLTSDLKEYRCGDETVAVVQFETVELAEVKEHHDTILATMGELAAAHGYDTFLFMATDIIAEGSELYAVGNRASIEHIFGCNLSKGSAWMDGMLSRKKQVAAKLLG
ncbi:MAG: manganese-dependent inorganic pyrophosphatase [Coriobacteriia bacterium]|nr:manganese-dependent inorganic pyrophosphatase [Coriobacteriia bacterium]